MFLYSGTLGFKHDPSLLLELARWARDNDAVVAVVSEGPGADWLATHGADEPGLRLLPYQPYERLPEVLASADVLVALLEPDAGSFSVPSKVLTYLCAGRPLLVSVSRDNLAARVVERSGGGSSCRRTTRSLWSPQQAPCSPTWTGGTSSVCVPAPTPRPPSSLEAIADRSSRCSPASRAGAARCGVRLRRAGGWRCLPARRGAPSGRSRGRTPSRSQLGAVGADAVSLVGSGLGPNPLIERREDLRSFFRCA